MKIVKLKGGLGNQMFQYAFALLLKKLTKEDIYYDLSYYSGTDDLIRIPRIKKFNLSLSECDEKKIDSLCRLSHKGNPLTNYYRMGIWIESKINTKYFFEKNRGYIDPNSICKYGYFDGYWQSYKYVDYVYEDIKKDFIPKDGISEKSVTTINKIKEENAVFIGVRKGDYSNDPSHYGSFDQVYYQRAMGYIKERIENPVFYVFSNDIEWCKNNIDWLDYNVKFRNKEDQVDDFEELIIMSSCKHAIVVNSTYNWWGAYLIENPNKIVCCPDRWFFDDKPIDIIPENWVRISKEK